jgi:hypothetical protein
MEKGIKQKDTLFWRVFLLYKRDITPKDCLDKYRSQPNLK